MTVHRGGCHCGAVRVRVSGPIDVVLECNCSICTMKGMLHWIVDRERFELERGSDALSCYQFGTKLARHYFCRTCGIAPYYVPRSHPESVDINLRCIEGVDFTSLSPQKFDGKNWERARAGLDGSDK